MKVASDHGTDLNRAIKRFCDTKPNRIIHEFSKTEPPETVPPNIDVRKGVHLYRAFHDPIPDEISILAGEVAQNLRSALDYLAWQLSLAQSESPPPTTAFPIFADGKLYERDKLRFIGGIDPAIHPVFDSVQPYHAGDEARNQPLWVLHRLANDDEHKIPHVVSSLPSGVGVNRPPGIDLFMGINQIGPFENGDVVFTLAITGGTDPKTELNVSGTFAVAFGKDTPAQGRHLANEIDRIGREVDATIEKFKPFFP
jgi:hypothetical protein